MKIICEDEVTIPSCIYDGTHPLIRELDKIRDIDSLKISVGLSNHKAAYNEADVFINLSFEDELDTSELENFLMFKAHDIRVMRNARVGAALSTKNGKIYTSTEIKPPYQNREKMKLEALFYESMKVMGKEYSLLADFMDTSTSIHAENAVIFEALKNDEEPHILTITRHPCLACCRLIRSVGISKTIYLNNRDYKAPSSLFIELTKEALNNQRLELFHGYGNRESYGNS